MMPLLPQKIIAGFLCILLLAPALSRAQELPIVFEDYPPYEFIEDGMVKGINMDLIREAFRRMGVKTYFEPRPWKRAVYQLKTGEILALSSGFKTAEREEFAYFPSEGLGVETNAIIAVKGTDLRIDSLEDLRDTPIGVVREYLYGTEFDSLKDLHKVETNSTQQLVQLLLNERLAVIAGSLSVIRHLAKKQNQLDRIKVLYKLSSEPLYLFFSRAHGLRAKNLAEEFGETIKEMKKDGTFKKIEDRY